MIDQLGLGPGFEILFWMIVVILSCFCCAFMLCILYIAYCEWGKKRKKERRKGMNVIYLCDKKECGEVCPNPECNHTTKLEHAVNFRAVTNEDGEILYYEEKEAIEKINVADLIRRFEDMAERGTLLIGPNVTQEDLLMQIIGTIVKEKGNECRYDC